MLGHRALQEAQCRSSRSPSGRGLATAAARPSSRRRRRRRRSAAGNRWRSTCSGRPRRPCGAIAGAVMPMPTQFPEKLLRTHNVPTSACTGDGPIAGVRRGGAAQAGLCILDKIGLTGCNGLVARVAAAESGDTSSRRRPSRKC